MLHLLFTETTYGPMRHVRHLARSQVEIWPYVASAAVASAPGETAVRWVVHEALRWRGVAKRQVNALGSPAARRRRALGVGERVAGGLRHQPRSWSKADALLNM